MKFRAKKLFKNGLDVSSRAITSEIDKKLIDGGIKHAAELYKWAALKLKIKTWKKHLNLTLLTTLESWIIGGVGIIGGLDEVEKTV